MSNKSIIKAFNGLCLNDIFRLCTAKEAVKAIKDYKEKKEEKDERIEYLKHEDIKKDGKTLRVWYGGNDSRCAVREKKENVQFPGKTEEKTMNRYRETIKEALSQTFEMMNKNKSEEEKEKEMKTGDKFIIELGEKTRIQSENSKGEWTATHECFRIDGTGSVISAEDLMNLEEYKENNDEKENVKHVSHEMLEKININPGKGMKKFQEEKEQRADVEKDSAIGKKFLIEIEKEEESCFFEGKGTSGRLYETVCKIKGTDAYITKTDLNKLEKKRGKEERGKIKVGDECRYKDGPKLSKDLYVILRTWQKGEKGYFDAITQKGALWLGGTFDLIEKTGRHYDEVEELLEKLEQE